MLKTLTIVAVLSALLAIWTDYKGPRKLFYLFKPLTTLVIIAIAITGIIDSGTLTIAPYVMIVGFVFCLVGDICIMLGEKTFLYGLGSFALAHLLFALSLVVITGFVFTWWLFLIFLVVGVSAGRFILPYTAQLKIPVIIYIVLICVMIWLSWERLNVLRDFASAYMVLGTLLFGISDTALAIDKFRRKYKSAELIILGTYFPAIGLMAYSLYLASV